jgi:predicted Zn-dependent peptidase
MTISAPVFADTVTVGWSTAPFGTPDDAALDILASMLTGHRDPLLTGSLFDRHLVTSLSARQFSHRAGSEFVLYAVCAPGAARQVVAQEIERIVRALPSSLDEPGVAQAHAAWKATLLSQLETPAGRAAMLTGQWEAGVEADRLSDWGLSLHVAAARDDLARTAARWLPWSHAVAVTMIADRWAPREGRIEARREAAP